MQFAQLQESSNVRDLQVLDRKVLLSRNKTKRSYTQLDSRKQDNEQDIKQQKTVECDLVSSDSVADSATQRSWIF